MADFRLTGGCQCGAVRYALSAPAEHTDHCHCGMCRRIHGAAMVTFSTLPRKHFRIERGADNLATYDSSPLVHRHFCKTCGCHLYIDDDKHPEVVEFATGTLDKGAHPGHADTALKHIYYKFKVPWLEVNDDLPKLEVT